MDVGEGVRPLNEVSMWEQLLLASFMQEYWADNQVLCVCVCVCWCVRLASFMQEY